jgi:hypothetical protein
MLPRPINNTTFFPIIILRHTQQHLHYSYGLDCSRRTKEYAHFRCVHFVQQGAKLKNPPETTPVKLNRKIKIIALLHLTTDYTINHDFILA